MGTPVKSRQSSSTSHSSSSASRAQIDDDSAVELIVKTWPHVREMLIRRGYDVEGHMTLTVTPELAASAPIYRIVPPMDQVAIDAAASRARAAGRRWAHVNAPTAPIMVVFTGATRIGVGTVRTVIERMQKVAQRNGEARAPQRAIIFSCQGYTTQVPTEIAKLAAPGQRVELATYADHQFCRVDHRLVPPHDILTPDQKAALLKRLSIPDDGPLPRQRIDDSVSRYYGLEPGDVVYYRRPMGTLELVHYFRVVVAEGSPKVSKTTKT